MNDSVRKMNFFRLSRNQIKWFALVLMICDHIGAIFVAPDTNLYFILRYVLGRSSYPLFCVLFVDGFFHTKRPWRHVLDLCVFGIISEFTYDLAFNSHCLFDWQHQNVMLSWLLCFLLCMVLNLIYRSIDSVSDNSDLKMSVSSVYIAMIGVILLFAVVAAELHVDYSYVCILTTGVVFFMKVFNDDVALWKLGLIVAIIDGICLMTVWTFPAVLILFMYDSNRYRAYKHKVFMKYFFYFMYPLHLGLFSLIYFLF